MVRGKQKGKPLFLIDGSSLLYRAYYGLSPLHTSDGTPVQAVYGFCRAIKKIIDDFDPQRMVLVWDASSSTARKELFEDYKARRQAAPSDLSQQKEAIVEFAELIGLRQVVEPGYEADDLIASLTKKYASEGVVIVGPDKDLFQLVSATVYIYDPFKKQLLGKEEVEKKYGFPPHKLAFYYALVGDASDNIPGVKGVGAKTATDLVQNFNDLDDLYARLDEVEKERVRRQLKEHEKEARLSFELFTLYYPEVKLSPEQLAFDKLGWHNAGDFFKRLEFKSLSATVNEAVQQKQIEYAWGINFVRTREQAVVMVQRMRAGGIISIDTETRFSPALQSEMVGISFACTVDEAYYLPLAHTGEDAGEQLSRDVMMEVCVHSLKMHLFLRFCTMQNLIAWCFIIMA
jgi:DNA polymerase-1